MSDKKPFTAEEFAETFFESDRHYKGEQRTIKAKLLAYAIKEHFVPRIQASPEAVKASADTDKCPACGSDDIYYSDWSGQIQLTGDQESEHDSAFNTEDVTVCAHYCGKCGELLNICVTEPTPAQPPPPPEVAQARAEIADLPDGITSDEGQRAYTEAEVQELLEAERQRVIQALGLRGIIGPGLVDSILAELREVKHA